MTQEVQHKDNNTKSRRSRFWGVVFWVALVVCVASLAVLGYILWGYYSANQEYEKLAEQAFSADEQTEQEPVGMALGDMSVDWDYLRAVNPEVVGWIYIPGTRINYPIVHAADNDRYLHMDFNGSSARGGAIFLDFNNKPAFTDENNIIYGHHMNDGSMFAALSLQLKDNAEFNAHRDVYVLTPTMNYKCKSFAMVITTGWDLIVQTSFENPTERAMYIKDKEDRSVVQPDEGMPDPMTIPRLITLSTCDYSQNNGRAVMFTQIVAQAVPGSGGAGEPITEDDQAALDEGLALEKEYSGEREPVPAPEPEQEAAVEPEQETAVEPEQEAM